MNETTTESTGIHPDAEAELIEAPKEAEPVDIDRGELRREAAKREKQQPIIQRVVKAVRKERGPFRELIINSEPLEKRVALISNGVLEKFEIERRGEDRIVGSIFKGKIQNLEHGLKAAFVDIAMPKNAFLHYWDINPSVSNDSSIEFIRDNRSEKKKKEKEKFNLKDIPKLYPIGSEIVVQVTKGTIGTKGPRTTTNISLAGRFLVLMPYAGQSGISKKIEEREERNRLKDILRKLTIPEDMGVIIRTAGEGKKMRYFVRDLHILLQTWEAIQEKIEESKDPVWLYQEPDIIERTVRDFLTEDIDRVLVDNKEDYQRMQESISRISPQSVRKLAYFDESIPVFERFNIERQIEQTFQRTVPLPSGGEIVIEETEALVAIDVNTGAHKSKDNNNFILQVNSEAAREAARQIRLRNMGGLVILDFIDMKAAKDRKHVLKIMREEMNKDKARTQILPISQLGIMQMTRQRHQESNSSGLYSSCPYCSSRGIVKSPRTVSVEIQRKLTSIIRRLRNQDAEKTFSLRVYCHPACLERMRSEDEKVLIEIEENYNVRLAFRADPIYHQENFKVVNVDTGQELR